MGKGGGCCTGCAKWLLIIFNVVFILIGVALIASGIYAFVELKDYLDILGNPSLNAPAIVLIVFGCITFIIAAIGCIGACKESSCLLFTYAVIIGILLIAEIATGIVAIVYQDKIEEWFDDNAPALMKEYNQNNEDATRDAWDFVQSELPCCGINGYQDWNDMQQAPMQYQNGPPPSCGTNPQDRAGCKQKLIDYIADNIVVVGGVALAFGLLEILGIVFACCVGCDAKRGTMS